MDGLAYDELPNDPQALKALVVERDQAVREADLRLIKADLQLIKADLQLTKVEAKYTRTIHKLQLEIAKLEEERRLDRARRFGASSEAGDHQYRLFDEAEASDNPLSEDIDEAGLIEVTAHTKRRPKRKPLPKNLPRVVVTHELPPQEQVCACGCLMSILGEKISEQLDVIPAQVYVIEHHRLTYSCRKCDESIKTAPMPPQPIPKSVASPGSFIS